MDRQKNRELGNYQVIFRRIIYQVIFRRIVGDLEWQIEFAFDFFAEFNSFVILGIDEFAPLSISDFGRAFVCDGHSCF